LDEGGRIGRKGGTGWEEGWRKREMGKGKKGRVEWGGRESDRVKVG